MVSHLVSQSPAHRETPAARDVVLHQTSGRIHNKNVSTHLIGNIKRGEGVEGQGRLLGANITFGKGDVGPSLISSPVPPSLPALDHLSPNML